MTMPTSKEIAHSMGVTQWLVYRYIRRLGIEPWYKMGCAPVFTDSDAERVREEIRKPIPPGVGKPRKTYKPVDVVINRPMKTMRLNPARGGG